jgi:hypothetical protein
LEVNGALSRSNDMTAQEKVPIYFATAVAHRVWLYWYSTVFNPSNWSNYFDEDEAVNFANIPFWVEAAVIGTLVCSIKADSPGFNETPSNVEIDPVGALTGGISMSAYKVINKIVPGFRVRETINPSESACDCQGHSALQQQELNLLR